MRRTLLTAALLCLALVARSARADNFPYVQDGPVITGVSDTDAWVVWYTAHHEGTGTECTIEEDTPLLGDDNTDTPTLTLNTGAQFTDTDCDRYHRVHLTGLTASTGYTFTLDKPWDSSSGAAVAGAFTTAPPAGSGAAATFVIYGDTRNDIALGGTDTEPDHQAVVNAILANENPAFLVHTGDMALNITAVSGDDKGYTEFFSVERPLLAKFPVFVVLGNHETIDTTFFDAMMDPARYDGSAHPYYSSFDWGKVHFTMGDSFEGSSTTLGLGGLNPGVTDAQAQWMDADLQNAQENGQVSFLGIHQGPYSHFAPASTDGHGGLSDDVIKLVPLMLKYGVLASIAGHDHYYERGHEGCIDYMVVGGGGAPQYAPDPTAPGVAIAQETLSYMVVKVNADSSASMTVKGTSGNVIDTFTFAPPDPNCDIDGGTNIDGGSAPLDAGSGSIDAGSEDAGTLDAGSIDAGAIDAGAFDAGAVDAGSGSIDAGSIDAGPSDAGSGSIDAGTHDAGTDNADAGIEQLPTASGCGCTSAGDTASGAGFFLAALLLFKRRRARLL